ncbi:unnamed protein product [Parnassius apollo]|uniref:(apollo) hypothetical protein n=1 Tax=Parnassius apollo TaxID=110799 RepID=A0A8S3WAW4_PARAO|nr:unnamed protein product [Parnassius apollo]
MRDIQMLDFRSAEKDVLKPTARWPFKISECKRFILKRSKTVGNVLIRGELHFNSDIGKAVNLCKTGMKNNMIIPSTVPLGAPMNRAKITDVDALLKKHFGAEWETNAECQFYVNIIRSPVIQEGHSERGEDDNENYYECRDDTVDLRI